MVMECPQRKIRRVHCHSPVTKLSTPSNPTTTVTTSTTAATTTTPICFSPLLSSSTSSSSRLAEEIQQENDVVTKACQTVVLYTEEQVTYIQRYLHLLRIERIEADIVQCADKDHFMRIDFTKYTRIDLLVDETMCGLLMVNDELHIDVHRQFEEIDSSDKAIYVSNKMSTGDELFDHLYFRLPRKARKLFKGNSTTVANTWVSERTATGLTGGKAVTNTGMTDETATTSSRLTGGTATTGSTLTGGTATTSSGMIGGTATTSSGMTGGAATTSTGMTGQTTTSTEMTEGIGRTATMCTGMTRGIAINSSGMTAGTSTMCTGMTSSSVTTSSGLTRETSTTSTGMTSGSVTTSTELTGGITTTGTGLPGETLTSTELIGSTATSSNVTGSVRGNVHYGNVETCCKTYTYEATKIGSESAFRKGKTTTEYDAVIPEGSSPNIVIYTIQCSQERQNEMILTIEGNKHQLNVLGPEKVEIATGSVIISLTMKEGFVVTDDWIQDVLRTIFDDILGSSIAEGETFTVEVGRYITNPDASLHENCVSKEDYMKQVEKVQELEKQVEELELENKTLLQQQMLEARMMLYIKHRTSRDYETPSSSGAHSADLSSEFSSKQGETSRQQEEVLPTETSLQEVHDGDATIIYYNTSQMLHEACRGGQLEVVRSLLSTGRVDINSRGEGGVTPVLIAAWSGNKQLFDLLVQNGCDLSLSLDNGNNILHLACFGGNVEIVDHIISNRIVDIESRGHLGRTAVMKAVNEGKMKVFQLFVAEGCNLSMVDDQGNNIFHVACVSDNVAIVDYLTSHNIANKESRGYLGRTPIMHAAVNGRKRVFDFLVSIGCSLSVVDDDGANILHLAAHGGNVSIVEHILTDQTIDINSRDTGNMTPLKWARYCKQDRVARVLMERGAIDI